MSALNGYFYWHLINFDVKPLFYINKPEFLQKSIKK